MGDKKKRNARLRYRYENDLEYREKVKARARKFAKDHKEELSELRRWRYKNDLEFREKKRASDKKYNEENSEKKRIRDRAYYKKNSKILCERQKKYAAKPKNKKRIKAYNAKPERKERARELQKYRYDNDLNFRKERIASGAKRRNKKKGLQSDLTNSQWDYALEYFENKCAYCLKETTDIMHQEHYIPQSKDGGYTSKNIIPSCKFCNSSKKDRDAWDWMEGQFGVWGASEINYRIQKYFDLVV